MRALRLPVGAKRRGDPFPLAESSPSLSLRGGRSPTWQSVTLSSQPSPTATTKGERIATAASGLAMTKSDFLTV